MIMRRQRCWSTKVSSIFIHILDFLAELIPNDNFLYAMPADRKIFLSSHLTGIFNKKFSILQYLFINRPNSFLRAKMKHLIREMRTRTRQHFIRLMIFTSIQIPFMLR